MYQLKSVNLDDLWQKDQGWDAERKSGRKFDDRAELEFWDKLAPTYSRQYNLYRDSVPLRDKLKEVFGEGKKIIDLGCGSGNFSIPLSKYSKEILALDFSPAMLKQLAISIKQEGCKNIRMVCSKWEDYTEDYQADFVLAVNSLYRVCYMRQVLSKIVLYGRKGFVIVRTLLRPQMYELYRDLGLSYRYNNDYILMPLMLWDMGINANVEYVSYTRRKYYKDFSAAEEEMKNDLGELSFLNFNDQLSEKFMQNAMEESNGFAYDSKRIVQIISYVK